MAVKRANGEPSRQSARKPPVFPSEHTYQVVDDCVLVTIVSHRYAAHSGGGRLPVLILTTNPIVPIP
jgi:hypothetical protein